MVIGVIGQVGAGKDELVHYLREHFNARAIATGDLVREKAERENVPKSRDGLQRVAKEYLTEQGDDFFAREAINRMAEQPDDIYVLSGLRTPADVETLRKKFGDDFKLVHVDVTHPMARFERLQERNEPRDPDSMDELLSQDKQENELFDLEQAIKMADVTVNNDGTLGAFHESIERRLIDPHLKDES